MKSIFHVAFFVSRVAGYKKRDVKLKNRDVKDRFLLLAMYIGKD